MSHDADDTSLVVDVSSWNRINPLAVSAYTEYTTLASQTTDQQTAVFARAMASMIHTRMSKATERESQGEASGNTYRSTAWKKATMTKDEYLEDLDDRIDRLEKVLRNLEKTSNETALAPIRRKIKDLEEEYYQLLGVAISET